MDNTTQGSSAALAPGHLGGGMVAIGGSSLNDAIVNMFTLMNLQNELKALGIQNSFNDAQAAAKSQISAGESKAAGMRWQAGGSLLGGGIETFTAGYGIKAQYDSSVQSNALSEPSIALKEAYDNTGPAAAGAPPAALTPEQLDKFKNFTYNTPETTNFTPDSIAAFKRDYPLGSEERTAFESQLTKYVNGTSAEHTMLSEKTRSSVQIAESLGRGLSAIGSGTAGLFAADSTTKEAKKDAAAQLYQTAGQAANSSVGVNDSAVQQAEQIVRILTEAYNQLAATGSK